MCKNCDCTPAPPKQVREAAARADALWKQATAEARRKEACAAAQGAPAGEQQVIEPISPATPKQGRSQVRKRAIWVTNVPNPNRRHRSTGKAKGRTPKGDYGLADAVRALMDRRGGTLLDAQREIADLIAEAEKPRVSFKSTLKRVLRALRKK
jgi:hypothetical protein